MPVIIAFIVFLRWLCDKSYFCSLGSANQGFSRSTIYQFNDRRALICYDVHDKGYGPFASYYCRKHKEIFQFIAKSFHNCLECGIRSHLSPGLSQTWEKKHILVSRQNLAKQNRHEMQEGHPCCFTLGNIRQGNNQVWSYKSISLCQTGLLVMT